MYNFHTASLLIMFIIIIILVPERNTMYKLHYPLPYLTSVMYVNGFRQ